MQMQSVRLVASTLLLSACASPYYGYSKGEWQNLTTAEQDAVKSEFQDIVNARETEKYRYQINSSKRNIIYRGVCGGDIGKRTCGLNYRP